MEESGSWPEWQNGPQCHDDFTLLNTNVTQSQVVVHKQVLLHDPDPTKPHLIRIPQ